MILIRREDPRPRLPQIHLHNGQTRRVTRRVAKIDARCDLEEWPEPGFEVEREVEVFGEVDPDVWLGRHAEIRMLQLLLVDINRDICALEVLQPTRMIQMHVSHDHGFYVLDVVPGFGDLGGQFVGCRPPASRSS